MCSRTIRIKIKSKLLGKTSGAKWKWKYKNEIFRKPLEFQTIKSNIISHFFLSLLLLGKFFLSIKRRTTRITCFNSIAHSSEHVCTIYHHDLVWCKMLWIFFLFAVFKWVSAPPQKMYTVNMALHVFARFWDNFNLEPWPFFSLSVFARNVNGTAFACLFHISSWLFGNTVDAQNAQRIQNLNRSKVLEHIPILNTMHEAANSCWKRARFSQQLKWHSKSNCERVV